MAKQSKTIKLGENVLEITDPADIQPVSADINTECRNMNGIICLSFGALIIDGSSKPEVRINARLRFNLAALNGLKSAIDSLLAQMEQPPKEAMN